MHHELLGAMLNAKIAVDDLRIAIFEIQEDERIDRKVLLDCISMAEQKIARLKTALLAEGE